MSLPFPRMSAGMGGMAPAGNTSMTSYSQGPPMTPGGPPAQHQGSYMGGPMGGSQQMQLRQAQVRSHVCVRRTKTAVWLRLHPPKE